MGFSHRVIMTVREDETYTLQQNSQVLTQLIAISTYTNTETPLVSLPTAASNEGNYTYLMNTSLPTTTEVTNDLVSSAHVALKPQQHHKQFAIHTGVKLKQYFQLDQDTDNSDEYTHFYTHPLTVAYIHHTLVSKKKILRRLLATVGQYEKSRKMKTTVCY